MLEFLCCSSYLIDFSEGCSILFFIVVFRVFCVKYLMGTHKVQSQSLVNYNDNVSFLSHVFNPNFYRDLKVMIALYPL